MTHKAIITDLNRCVGCLSCMVACKALNGVDPGKYWIKVLRVGPTMKEGGTWPNDVEMYFLPVQCQHCENPECVNVCPTSASYVAEDGTIQIDAELCIGCQSCITACPYGVRYLNEAEGVVEKCNLCEDKIEKGELPQCVAQCAARARFFGDLDEGIESFVSPEAPESGVEPSYDNATAARANLVDYVRPFTDDDIYHLPDVGNGPNVAYILRNRTWQSQDVSMGL